MIKIVAVAGARRSGKSTYIREKFPHAKEVTLPLSPYSLSNIEDGDDVVVRAQNLRDAIPLMESEWESNSKGEQSYVVSPKTLVIEVAMMSLAVDYDIHTLAVQDIPITLVKIPSDFDN